jgi:hypothetical protein
MDDLSANASRSKSEQEKKMMSEGREIEEELRRLLPVADGTRLILYCRREW